MEQPHVAPGLLIAAIVILVVVAGTIIFIMRRLPGHQKRSERQAQATSDAERIKAEYAAAGMPVKSSFFTSANASGAINGVAFTHKVVPGGKNSPPHVTLEAPSALRGEFGVRREGGSEGFFKAIGFAGEAQTGDAAFDREFYLTGTSHEYVQALFADAQNREAVRALFELGFDNVELHDGKLRASRSPQAQLFELAVVRNALERFAALRTTPAAMQVAMQGIGGLSTRQVNTACATALGIAIAAFMAMIFLLEPMVDGQFAMFTDSWRPALIAYGVLIAATLLLLRGRANAPKELAMIALLGLPSIWVIGVSAAMLSNQYLDRSPPQTVRVLLLRHYVTRSKDSTSYHFVFPSWRRSRSRDDVDIEVPYEIYNKARPEQWWVLQTRAGRLGYEWVDTLAPEKRL